LDFLDGHGIRLADIYSKQHWHPGPQAGHGFLTVGEALWLRTIDSLLTDYDTSQESAVRAIKQAAIGMSFKRFSYAHTILERMCGYHEESELENLCNDLGFEFVWKLRCTMNTIISEDGISKLSKFGFTNLQ